MSGNCHNYCMTWYLCHGSKLCDPAPNSGWSFLGGKWSFGWSFGSFPEEETQMTLASSVIQEYSRNCSWVCLMVGKTLDNKLLIDDHQLFGIIQQPYQILNDVATVSSLMQSCKCFIFISVQRSELSQAIATSVDFLQALPAVQNNRDLQVLWRMITVLTIEEIPHYGDQFKYQCQLIFQISSLLISNFHAQPWFLTLFKNPGIYFVQIPMPFSSWSSEPVCSPVWRNGTGNFSV